MQRVVAGSVSEMGGLVVHIGLIYVCRSMNEGGSLPGGPTQAKPAVLGCQGAVRGEKVGILTYGAHQHH